MKRGGGKEKERTDKRGRGGRKLEEQGAKGEKKKERGRTDEGESGVRGDE